MAAGWSLQGFEFDVDTARDEAGKKKATASRCLRRNGLSIDRVDKGSLGREVKSKRRKSVKPERCCGTPSVVNLAWTWRRTLIDLQPGPLAAEAAELCTGGGSAGSKHFSSVVGVSSCSCCYQRARYWSQANDYFACMR